MMLFGGPMFNKMFFSEKTMLTKLSRPAALLQKRLSHDLRQLLGGINISLWGISTNLRDICIDIWASDNCTASLNMVPRGEQSLVHFLYLALSYILWVQVLTTQYFKLLSIPTKHLKMSRHIQLLYKRR